MPTTPDLESPACVSPIPSALIDIVRLASTDQEGASMEEGGTKKVPSFVADLEQLREELHQMATSCKRPVENESSGGSHDDQQGQLVMRGR